MKTWTKPTLIVLTRSNAQESVLGCCKNSESLGPEESNELCRQTGACCYPCAAVVES